MRRVLCSIGCYTRSCFLTFVCFASFATLHFVRYLRASTALLIGLLIGPFVIEKLREFQIGQYIREEGPQSHQKKSGTPTMGGLLICISILVPTLLWADLSNPFIWVVMLSTVAFGAIGFADDYIKVVHRRNQGLTGRQKLALQFLVSAGVAVALLNMEVRGGYSTRLVVPFVKRFRPDLVWEWMGHIPHMHWLEYLPFVIFVMIVIAGSSNAVNLTDGLDGLAIGCTIIAAGAFDGADVCEWARGVRGLSGVTADADGERGYGILRGDGGSEYRVPLVQRASAEVFMGDVGSLALGARLLRWRWVIKQELLLPFIGGRVYFGGAERDAAGGEL